jgi:hypothetical protein
MTKEQICGKELSPLGYTPEEEAVHQALMEAGLLKEVKPRTWEDTSNRPMGTIQGKPLSETIIEERR